jgi:hypothetical protein
MRMPPVKLGQVYGKLTVVSFDGYRLSGKQNISQFICRCTCGNALSVQGRLLKSGNSTSCGCKLAAYRAKLKGTPQCDAIPGQKWNKLTFIKWLYTKKKRAICEFECECGKHATLSLTNVKNGKTESCGCLRLENARKMGLIYGGITELVPGKSAFNRLLRTYRKNAKDRGLCFNLTMQ